MQIVIDIPDEIYKKYMDDWTHSTDVLHAVRHGTPLPKYHGRLVDADWVKNTLDIYVINEYNGQFIRRNDIDKVPTTIEGSENK